MILGIVQVDADDGMGVDEHVHEVDYYELLGVRRTASPAQIKSAYRSMAKVMHPDAGGNASNFQRLQLAYETLIDSDSRAEYDASQTPITPPSQPSVPWTTRIRRTRNLGDDPNFVPNLPDLDSNTVSWLGGAQTAEAIMYLPLVVPGHAPAMIALGGWFLLLSSAVVIDFSPLLLTSWIVTVAAASAGIFQLARRYLVAGRLTKSFTAELGKNAEFGVPGQEDNDLAERLTAELLSRYLTQLPAARIFHGLRLPGSVFVDVDHAVLCGRRLVLIESKLWLPGHYSANSDGKLWRNGHPFRGGVIRLPQAIAAYRRLLPGITVRGAVIVYPSRTGNVTTSDPVDDSVSPMTPEWFVRNIGEWLAAQQTTIDRDVFRVLREQCGS